MSWRLIQAHLSPISLPDESYHAFRSGRLQRIGGRLHVVHLGVARLVIHQLVAGRAVPAGLDGGAAGKVTRGVRRVGVPGSPLREEPERPGEFGALRGQLVGGPGWPLGVGPGHQQRPSVADAGQRLGER